MARSPVTVADLIEDSRVSGLQYRAFVLAASSLVVDGYDTQAVAYVAPVISKDWSLATGAFGPVFAAGGTATLLLVPVLQWKLPESLRFLVMRVPSGLQTLQMLRRLVGTRSTEHIELICEQQTEQVRGWAALFSDGRMGATATYGCLAFLTLLTLYLLNNWLPTLIHAMGFDIRQASWSTAGFQLGGILGAIALGLLSDRLGPIRIVVAAYAAAATIIAAIGAIHGPSLVALAAFGAGFTIVGAQSCNNAMVAGLYPTAVRGKALGLNLTIGRMGSIVGPSVTGWLLLRDVPPQRVLLWAAAPVAFAALLLLATTNSIRRLQERERRESSILKRV